MLYYYHYCITYTYYVCILLIQFNDYVDLKVVVYTVLCMYSNVKYTPTNTIIFSCQQYANVYHLSSKVSGYLTLA